MSKSMTAREMVRAAYGDSKNILTPKLVKYGKIGKDRAFELSMGEGFKGETVYGLTVVKNVSGSIVKDFDNSGAFFNISDVEYRLGVLTGEIIEH